MYLEITKVELFDLLNNHSIYIKHEIVDDIYEYYISVNSEIDYFETKKVEYYKVTKAIVIDLLRNFYYKCDKFEIRIIE
jgi:hypothetical protein